MNIATVKAKLRKGRKGTFRPLQVGEAIAENDIIVGDNSYDYVAACSVGSPCEKTDTIIRLEFEK